MLIYLLHFGCLTFPTYPPAFTKLKVSQLRGPGKVGLPSSHSCAHK